ncbi:hypothetical protein D3C73_1173970 [compost metagenome]
MPGLHAGQVQQVPDKPPHSKRFIMNNLDQLRALLRRCRHSIKQRFAVSLHHRKRCPDFVRNISYEIPAHFFQLHFFGNITQNRYRPADASIRSKGGHMYGPYAFFYMDVHALVAFLIQHFTKHLLKRTRNLLH